MAAKSKRKGASASDLDALYEADLGDFTRERDELAKRLKADGEAEEAKRVKALRKPSLPAWAINQAARSDPAAAKRLVKAGKGLARAQEKAMGGGGREQLKEAMGAEGQAVEEMLAAVVGATGDGPSLNSTMLDRVRDTLRAVAGDEELRADFEDARVTADRKPVGFGGAEGAVAPRSKPKRAAKSKPSAKKVRDAEARGRRAERAAKAAAKRLTQAQKGLERAQESLANAEEKLREAEGEKASSDSDLDEAQAALADLQAR